MTHAPRGGRLEFDGIADLASAVRSNGGRLSAPRRAVLEALFAAEGPVAAEYIAEGRDGRGSRLDLVSVYRALEHLERLGAVQHVHLGHGPGLYALTGRGEREYLVCERCNRVTAVEPAQLDAVRALVSERFGYEAAFTHFPITGLCASCADQAPRGGRARRSTRGGAMSAHEHPHEELHSHEHSHGDVTHDHPHTDHDHDHVEHEHPHSHGDRVHSHSHTHEEGLEEDHEHSH